MTYSVDINIQISDDAAKAIVAGACFLGACWLAYKYFENLDEKAIPLPKQAKGYSELPELSPQTFDELGFHPLVKKRAAKSFHAGDFVSSVRTASIALFDLIRIKSGIDSADATRLIQLAFRGEPKKGVSARLSFQNLAPNHVTNMGDGYIQMFEGFAKTIRKVHMHAQITITKARALKEISLACYLAEVIEENTVLAIEDGGEGDEV